MRRLVLGSVVLACMLASCAATAAAEVTVEVELPASNGFSAKVEASGEHVGLSVIDSKPSRGSGRYNVYVAKGEVDETAVEAQFGRLGQISLEFQPTSEDRRPAGPGCPGEQYVDKEGFFVGEIQFRGEQGYTTIDAQRVKGTVAVKPPPKCRGGRLPRAAERDRGDVAALRALDRAGRTSLLALGGTSRTGRYEAEFLAGSLEHSEAMTIGRYAFAATNQRDSFVFDHEAGTATIRPPAPFRGSASFVRHGGPQRPGRWRGDLSVSLLGQGPLRLAGAAFRTTLNRNLPYFQ